MITLIKPQVYNIDIAPKPKGRPRGAVFGSGKKRVVKMYTPQATLDYQDDLAREVSWQQDKAIDPIDEPCVMFCHFAKKSRHRIDLDNLVKALGDAMNEMIYTDDYLVHMIHSSMEYNKENPKVLFTVVPKSHYDKKPIEYIQWWMEHVESVMQPLRE